MTKFPNKFKKTLFLAHFWQISLFWKYYFQKIWLCHAKHQLGPEHHVELQKKGNEPIPRKLQDVFYLSIWGNVLTLQTAHGNFLILSHVRWFYFLILTFWQVNKTRHQKIMKQVLLFYSCFIHRQTELYNQI